jgi:4-amino-4-deoxy-L-arabinose transferase-like glycosyltransferase
MTRQGETITAGLILAAFVLLALGFSSGPLFEAPDEINHYLYGRYLATHLELPDAPNLPIGEYHQAPLYYALIAPITALAGDRDFAPGETAGNRYTYIHAEGSFNVPGNDNKNFYLHPRSEQFPYHLSRTALAIHLARLISVLLGIGTLLAAYALFGELWPTRQELRLLALGITAFWPQFIYLSGTLNNDSLLICLCTVLIWQLVRTIKQPPSWRSAFWMGMVLGALLLTKVSALVMVIPFAAAVLPNIRQRWRYVALMLGTALLVGGWWYVRNWVLYNDPLQSQILLNLYGHESINGGRWTAEAAAAGAPQAYSRLWARFGWLDVTISDGLYRFFDLVTAVGLIGSVLYAIRSIWNEKGLPFQKSSTRAALVIMLLVVAWLVMLIYYSGRTLFGNQGRYLLPGIAGMAAIFAYGWMIWIPARFRLRSALSGIALMATVACVSLFGYFLPAYAPSPVPPVITHPLAIRLGDVAEITGIDPYITRAAPGQMVRIKVYWRAFQPADTSLTAFLHSAGENVVFRDSLPATGNLLSTDWLPGQTWADDYVVIIPQNAATQRVYPLLAGLYDHADNNRLLPATDANGSEITPFVGQVAIHAPPDPFDPDYRLGDVIGLAGPQIKAAGPSMQVCLRWVSLKETDLDYHVFIHVLDSAGTLIEQQDFVPKQGQYPTWGWVQGESIEECVPMEKPAGDWQIRLGMYDILTGARLPITARDGSTLLDGQVVINP